LLKTVTFQALIESLLGSPVAASLGNMAFRSPNRAGRPALLGSDSIRTSKKPFARRRG
jgi:hypothetical protein